MGCDDRGTADKAVRQQLTRARELTATDAEGARQLLTTAAANADASPAVRAAAQAALAQAELDAAHVALRAIDRTEMQLARSMWQIGQLAGQIHTGSSTAEGYSKYESKPARDALAEKIAEAEGGPSKAVWITHEGVTLPTLFAVAQEISRIKGEIAQRQEQIKNLTDQRTKLIEDAEQAAGQVDQLKGEQSVEVYKRASNLRRQASEKAIEIDKLQAQVTRLERDLAVAEGQQAVLNDVIAQLKSQSGALDQAQKDLEAQIAKHKQLSTQILGSPGSAPAAGGESSAAAALAGASIAQKAQEMARLVDELGKLRTDAQTTASSAASKFEAAYQSADQMRQDLETKMIGRTDRPEMAAWRSMIVVMDPTQFRVQQAGALRTLAGIHASRCRQPRQPHRSAGARAGSVPRIQSSGSGAAGKPRCAEPRQT
jgi:hypothetical protein